MHKLKKMLLPLLLVFAMLLMSSSSFAASSPTPKKIVLVIVTEKKYYTGVSAHPKHNVYDDEGNLVPKKYYTDKYKNNKHAGTASLTVKAKAPYTGSASATFKITKASTKVKVVKLNKNSYRVYARIRDWKGRWIRDAQLYGGKVTFSVSNKRIAKIDKNGIIRRKNKKKGTVTVTVKVKKTKDFKGKTHKVKIKFK